MAAQPSTTRGVPVHLSYDPKSDRIAYASNRSIFLRSVSDPEKSVQYVNHSFPTTVAKFSPSGFYVASGDDHGNVKVWDCVGEDMVTKGEYQVISGRICDLTWDADSQRIIAVGDGRERYGHCFTWDSGNSVGEISGHTGVVNSVSIRPVRPYRAATVSDDGNLVFYQGPPFRFTHSQRDCHSNFVHEVEFSPDGKYIVSVGADKKIVLYDGKEGQFLGLIGEDDGHQGGIFGVAWSPDSTKLATASADGSVRLWDVETKKAIRVWRHEYKLDNQQMGVVFAGPDRIISVAFNGDLIYYKVDSDEVEKRITGHQRTITAVTNKDNVYTASYDGTVVRWNGNTAESVEKHKGLVLGMVAGSKIWSASWDDTLKTISGVKFDSSVDLGSQPKAVSGYEDNVAIAFDDAVQLYLNGSKGPRVEASSPSAVDISKDSVAVGLASSVELYDTKLGHLASLPMRSATTYLAFSPNGEYLAAGDASGKITVFKVSDRSVYTSRWSFHASRITYMNWHPSGDYLVSGSVDTNVFVYSLQSPGKNVKYPNAHVDGVNVVCWTGDNTFVSGGADACVKHWQVEFKK